MEKHHFLICLSLKPWPHPIWAPRLGIPGLDIPSLGIPSFGILGPLGLHPPPRLGTPDLGTLSLVPPSSYT